jgi:hypothetical protein
LGLDTCWLHAETENETHNAESVVVAPIPTTRVCITRAKVKVSKDKDGKESRELTSKQRQCYDVPSHLIQRENIAMIPNINSNSNLDPPFVIADVVE